MLIIMIIIIITISGSWVVPGVLGAVVERRSVAANAARDDAARAGSLVILRAITVAIILYCYSYSIPIITIILSCYIIFFILHYYMAASRASRTDRFMASLSNNTDNIHMYIYIYIYI